MNNQIAANITLDAVSTILLLLFILPLLRRNEINRRVFMLTAAGILHLIAQEAALVSTVIILRHPEHARLNMYSLLSVVLNVIAATVIVLKYILSDKDGKPRFINREEPIPVRLAAALLLPILAAILLENIFHGVRLIGFSFTVGILLCREIMIREEEQSLNEKEKVLDLRQAKLLSEQMQPHFIFNALMSIQELCYTDGGKAAKCLEDFSGYLRGNIDALTSEDPIPFETELEHIQQYIALERAGSDRAFTVSYDLEITDFLLPALTVQPIVENAVKHGARCRRDGCGTVCLKTEHIGKIIRITVSDNGNGSEITENQRTHRSVGLKNVRTRLQTQCGGEISLTHNKDGSTAIITIPMMHK